MTERYAQPSAQSTTFVQRTADMAASLLAAHGPFYGNRAFQYVPDAGRAAQLRRWEAERLVGDADRRAAAFAARPCAFCGQAFDGERTDVGGEPMCRDCCAEWWHALPEFAPLAPAGLLRVVA